MTAMDDYIKRNAAQRMFADSHDYGLARKLDKIPAAPVMEVRPELREAVNLLHKEYEKAKQNPIVRDPLAFALYQVWKVADGKGK